MPAIKSRFLQRPTRLARDGHLKLTSLDKDIRMLSLENQELRAETLKLEKMS